MPRTSHAVRVGRQRLADRRRRRRPALDERIRALGEPAGVVQLARPAQAATAQPVAERLGVRLYVTPFADVTEAPFVACPLCAGSGGRSRSGSPTSGSSCRRRAWAASATSGRRTSRSASIRCSGSSRRSTRSAGLEPEHVLFGHGAGYHGSDAPREAAGSSGHLAPPAAEGATSRLSGAAARSRSSPRARSARRRAP